MLQIKNATCGSVGKNTIPDAILLAAYRTMIAAGEASEDPILLTLLRKRNIRTQSGIAPVSVLLPPAPCKSACVYCPTEQVNTAGKTLYQIDSEKKYGVQQIPTRFRKPGAVVMPKSYLSNEPGAMRALLAGFDPYLQISRRLTALRKTGHSPEKCELIIQGGTFSDIPKASRTRFVTRCYQSFNQAKAGYGGLQAAQQRNESARCRVIGLTLETRPGGINTTEIRDYRRLGCTRVEIGVQTLDDEINRKTRRLQTRAEVVMATKLLREAGFKICYHMMPGLPFSTPEQDLASYREICENPDFKPDLVKIYPCSVVPFSELFGWYRNGKYLPYPEDVLEKLLVEMKKMTPPWIRISRLIRDIPGTSIAAGSRITNLRQLIQEKMSLRGERCRCIRCREVRDVAFVEEDVQYVIREYAVSSGKEYFLSYELADETLIAMLRLFVPNEGSKPVFRALRAATIIRELHTYGQAMAIGKKSTSEAQHTGFGGKLLVKAEELSKQLGFSKIAVISGIGVKDYYRKRGFADSDTYLVKPLV